RELPRPVERRTRSGEASHQPRPRLQAVAGRDRGAARQRDAEPPEPPRPTRGAARAAGPRGAARLRPPPEGDRRLDRGRRGLPRLAARASDLPAGPPARRVARRGCTRDRAEAAVPRRLQLAREAVRTAGVEAGRVLAAESAQDLQ